MYNLANDSKSEQEMNDRIRAIEDERRGYEQKLNDNYTVIC